MDGNGKNMERLRIPDLSACLHFRFCTVRNSGSVKIKYKYATRWERTMKRIIELWILWFWTMNELMKPKMFTHTTRRIFRNVRISPAHPVCWQWNFVALVKWIRDNVQLLLFKMKSEWSVATLWHSFFSLVIHLQKIPKPNQNQIMCR